MIESVYFAGGLALGFIVARLWHGRSPPIVVVVHLDGVHARLDQLLTLAKATKRLEEAELVTLAELKAKVEAEATVVNSAVTLINGLSQQLKDALAAGADPAAIQAIADELDAQSAALASAVAANTIAEPTPEPAQVQE